MAWLKDTPADVFDAMAAMLPRLEAHDASSHATQVAVGRSLQPGPWAKRQLQEWDRDADSGGQPKKKPTANDLAAVGIGIKVVKRG